MSRLLSPLSYTTVWWRGFEPPTLRIRTVRATKLRHHQAPRQGVEPRSSASKAGVLPLDDLEVETRGIEPRTSAVRQQRSTSLSYVPIEGDSAWTPYLPRFGGATHAWVCDINSTESGCPGRGESESRTHSCEQRPFSRRVALPIATSPWREQDSNLRPPGYEPDELPLLYPAWIIGDSDPTPLPCKSSALPNELMTRASPGS